jgi:ubiquinone/menaquinone biosynthesis C-methylase UbiE
VIVPFTLPPQSPGKPIPIWAGNGFSVGDNFFPVLEYSSNAHGWTDDLTIMHEETAGSNHFIDQASRHHVLEQLRKYVRGNTPVILEVGCSSGFMLRLIRDHLTDALVMGSDVVHGPLEKLAENLPNVPLFRFDLIHCPLPDNSVDAVVMLNVLEHIENDMAAIQQVYRILKPGGIAVIEVPAGPNLYDVYDKLLRHFRRYTLTGLCELVKKANFKIVEQSHLGFLMYPGFWLVKQRNKRFLSEDAAAHRQIVEKNIRDTGGSPLLKAIMHLELALGRWVSYPFGIRCLLSCTKLAA